MSLRMNGGHLERSSTDMSNGCSRGHHQRNVVKSDNCSLNIGLNFDDSSELRLQLRNESENEKMTKATSSEDRMIVA